MRSRTLPIAASTLLASAAAALAATSPVTHYSDQDALTTTLSLLAHGDDAVVLRSLSETAGGRDLPLLEIAPPGSGDAAADRAVLVVADPLGETPLATEAALELARRLVRDADGSARALSWYIVPCLDPDGAARFFAEPRRCDGANDRPEDDDRDGDDGEDGPDDLDGDGLIAQMLLPDPEGEWRLDDEHEPAWARKADPAAGERGLYRLLVEGDDDDGDGLYNEDGPGGAVPGRNFPHGFVHWQTRHGPWPASETESRALLEFAFAHPEIALVVVFGAANTLAAPPGGEETADPLTGKHKPPRWLARETGLDTQTEYSVEELLAAVRGSMSRPELDEDDVVAMLDLGPAAAPPAADRAWWSSIAAAYVDSLDAAGLDAPRVAPAPSGPGSVVDWAYYQFGTPAFALDFWSPPLPAAPADTLDAADGAAPPDTSAAGETGGGEKDAAGGTDVAALAALDGGALDGRGLLPWREVGLRDGRRALIGGEAPFALRTPPEARVDSLLAKQLPFVLALPGWLARLDGLDVEVEPRGRDVWAVTARVRNGGRLPYPTTQGRRTRRPRPVAVAIEGVEVLEGRTRQVLKQVPAMGAATARWLVRGDPGAKLHVRAGAPGFGSAADETTLPVKGGER